MLVLQCTLFPLSSGASLESICSGSLSQDRTNQCGVEPSNQTIYHMENKINFSAVLLCSQKMRHFFIWGTFVHVSPIYFTGGMRCDSSIVLYVCRIRTFIKLTNSEKVTIIHTAAGKTATCSVLDIFSREQTALSRYPEGHKSLLSGTYEHAHSLTLFLPFVPCEHGRVLLVKKQTENILQLQHPPCQNIFFFNTLDLRLIAPYLQQILLLYYIMHIQLSSECSRSVQRAALTLARYRLARG